MGAHVSKVFREVMRRYIAPPSSIGLDRRALNDLREMLRHIRRLTGRDVTGETFNCDWITNNDFNAVATSAKGHEIVGLFTGTVTWTYAHVFLFLSDPDVLRDVGEVSVESRNDIALATLRSNLTTVTRLPRRPRDDTRNFAAHLLAWNALLFLVFHEISHLKNCHLRLLSEECGTRSFQELPASSLTAAEADLRMLLELDADYSAADMSLQVWRNTWDEKANDALGSVGADKSWLISVAILFRIMDGRLKGGPARFTSHPPPLFRFFQIAIASYHSGPLHMGSAGVSTDAYRIVQNWWDRNELPTSGGDHGIPENPTSHLFLMHEALRSRYGTRLNDMQAERLGIDTPTLLERQRKYAAQTQATVQTMGGDQETKK
jgi:hypothetical protein